MESENYVKTFKREELYFDIYEVIAPIGDVLVEEDGVLVSKVAYDKQTQERPIEYDIVKTRYKEHIDEYNDIIESKDNKLDQVNVLEESIKTLDEDLEEVEGYIKDYETNLIKEEDIISDETAEEIDAEE